MLISENRKNKKRKELELELERERRAEIIKHRSIWGDDICKTLINKKISLGMTTDMVALSWGVPTNIDQREITKKGEKFRWVYGIPRQGANYIWFTDDKVTKMKT